MRSGGKPKPSSNNTVELPRSKSLAQAHEVALELRADPLRQAIESLARRSRARLETSNAGPEDDQQARFGLTPREIEVLRLVAAGMTNREIGDSLFISNKTASVHVSNVLAKLGASRRSEAAVVATRIGLGPEQAAMIDDMKDAR